MMRKYLFLSLLALFLFEPVPGRQIAVFTDHIMPDAIYMDDSRFYITEGFSIYIYSLDNFSLMATFGKKGEGPGEFKGRPELNVRGPQILVNSPSKVSFFSKTGILIREVNGIVSGRNFVPLGNGYVGYHTSIHPDGIRYSGIHVYDSGFKKVKTVFSYQSIAQSQRGRGWHLFSKTYINPLVCGDKIVVAGGNDFVIDIFDPRGQKLFSINREYLRVHFTETHRQKVLELYKTRPSTAPDFDWWKKNIHFPEYFPAVRAVYTDDHRIYVRTYRQEKRRSEFFVFDGQGRLLKKVMLPVAPSNAKNAYPYMQDFSPFTIKDNRFYQLILNEETEEWSLHVRPV